MKIIEYFIIPVIIIGMIAVMIYQIAEQNAQERLYQVPVINVI